MTTELLGLDGDGFEKRLHIADRVSRTAWTRYPCTISARLADRSRSGSHVRVKIGTEIIEDGKGLEVIVE